MSLGHVEAGAAPAEAPIELLADGARLHHLEIMSAGLAEYLTAIPAEKRLIAITHVIEVGLTEVLARRERWKK